MYRLLQSCIRVFRSGATTCNQAEEECCDVASSDTFTNVFSLYNPNTIDYLITTSEVERDNIIAAGIHNFLILVVLSLLVGLVLVLVLSLEFLTEKEYRLEYPNIEY